MRRSPARRPPLRHSVCNACDTTWNGSSSQGSRARTCARSWPSRAAPPIGAAKWSSITTTPPTRCTSSRRAGSTSGSRRGSGTWWLSRSAGRARRSASSQWSRAPSGARPSPRSSPARRSCFAARSCGAWRASMLRSTTCSSACSRSMSAFCPSGSSSRTRSTRRRGSRGACSSWVACTAAHRPSSYPLIQEELAALAGTSRATVNRVLREAEGRGVVEVGRGRTVLLDPDGLERLARLRA